MRKIKYYLLKYSRYIVGGVNISYALIYGVFKLYDRSIYYNYILLLLFGIYLGYELSLYANLLSDED
jgi:hypothetical protein